MGGKDIVALAEEYCRFYHEGQRRKGGNQAPYAVHPFEVRDLLVRYGYDDPETQAIALLHDTVEDTRLKKNKKEIEKVFGTLVYNGVYVLSYNTLGKYSEEVASLFELEGVHLIDPKREDRITEQAYRLRLLFNRDSYKRIKVADVARNTISLPDLSKSAIERKIEDAETFYIPLGKAVAPLMVNELIANIENYRRSAHYNQLFLGNS